MFPCLSLSVFSPFDFSLQVSFSFSCLLTFSQSLFNSCVSYIHRLSVSVHLSNAYPSLCACRQLFLTVSVGHGRVCFKLALLCVSGLVFDVVVHKVYNNLPLRHLSYEEKRMISDVHIVHSYFQCFLLIHQHTSLIDRRIHENISLCIMLYNRENT